MDLVDARSYMSGYGGFDVNESAAQLNGMDFPAVRTTVIHTSAGAPNILDLRTRPANSPPRDLPAFRQRSASTAQRPHVFGWVASRLVTSRTGIGEIIGIMLRPIAPRCPRSPTATSRISGGMLAIGY